MNPRALKRSRLTLTGKAPSCKWKVCWFNSQSGNMPGLWARSLVGGVGEATNQCFSCTLMFLSLSYSFSSPFSLFTKNSGSLNSEFLSYNTTYSRYRCTWTTHISLWELSLEELVRRLTIWILLLLSVIKPFVSDPVKFLIFLAAPWNCSRLTPVLDNKYLKV